MLGRRWRMKRGSLGSRSWRRPELGSPWRRGDRPAGIVVASRGQVHGERAALSERALEGELAAEQMNDLAADRKAQSGTAVLAGRSAVGLREGLEDAVLQPRLDADAGVADAESR